MNLDRLSIVLRPRHNFEAIDLGIRMAVHWFNPIYIIWLIIVAPVVFGILTIQWIFFDGSGFWSLFILWWLKPLADRILVYLAGQIVFGYRPTLTQTLKMLPTLLFRTRILRALTIGRLSPFRSLLLGVDVLEGVRGATASQRRRLIAANMRGSAFLLTIFFLFLEIILPYLLLGFLFFLDSTSEVEFTTLRYWLFADKGSLPYFVFPYLMTTAFLLLEPFYVCAGFSLYLKRRTSLEAWDLELQFRKLTQKYASVRHSALALCVCLGVSALTGFNASSALAAETPEQIRQQQIQLADKTLKAVLSGPEYGQEITVKERVWKTHTETPKKTQQLPNWGKNREYRPPPEPNLSGFEAIRFLAWAGLFVLVGFLLYLIFRNVSPGFWRRNNDDAQVIPPSSIGSLDIRPESLPKNIGDVARNLMLQHEYRAALSLLYRGALSVLAHRDRVPFTSSDTEQDCINRVTAAEVASLSFFVTLTHDWLQEAYAHQTQEQARLLSLCQEWPTHFDHQAQWKVK